MRFLYTLLVYLASPLVFVGLVWRGLKDRGYWVSAGERFGYSSALNGPSIWVHAVSVGEVRAAAILVPRLMERWPTVPIVMTTTTPTGARQVRDLFGTAVYHRYLPFDLPGSVNRFLDNVRPRIAIVMETEIWPNLFIECGERGIPVLIASARLSARSVDGYQRLSGLLQQVFAQDVTIAAQSAADAARYQSIGASPDRLFVTGNVKFDLAVPERIRDEGRLLREAMGERFVWIAGSTRDQEESILLDAFQQLRGSQPDLLLVLVPRHPQRFAEVEALLEKRGIPFVTRSGKAAVTSETEVLLVDTLGELLGFYAAGDIAFVGGTLAPIGGHNLLEPAALGLPVLTGPHVFNAPDVARLLLAAGAAIEVHSAGEIAAAVAGLRKDAGDRQQRGAAGRKVVEDNGGAVGKVMELVAARMDRR